MVDVRYDSPLAPLLTDTASSMSSAAASIQPDGTHAQTKDSTLKQSPEVNARRLVRVTRVVQLIQRHNTQIIAANKHYSTIL